MRLASRSPATFRSCGSAALADPAQATRRVRRRHQAAVRGERIRAEHEQILGAIEIRNRNRERRAEHRRAREHLRQLIDARRREASLGAERAQQRRQIQRGAEIVRVGIAGVGGERLGTVRVAHSAQALGRERERLVPADLLPAIGSAAQRMPQPVRVFLERLQAVGLGAEVTPAERILFVTADRDHLAGGAVDLDRDPALGLAQRAGAEDDVARRFGCGSGHACLRRARGRPVG